MARRIWCQAQLLRHKGFISTGNQTTVSSCNAATVSGSKEELDPEIDQFIKSLFKTFVWDM